MKLTLLTLLCSSFATCLPVIAAERALLVGVGRYSDPKNNLPGIDLDLAAQHDVLLKIGFKDEQIHVLRDEQSTDQNIRSEIQNWLTSGVKPDDRVVFYYSGHGSLVKDTTGETVGILVPHDIAVQNGKIMHAITGKELRALIEQIPSRHVLLVLDSCNSGNITDGAKSLGDDVVPKFFRYPGMPTGAVSFLGDTQAKGISTKSGSNYVLLSACQKTETATATNHGSLLTVTFADEVKKTMNQSKPINLNTLEPVIEREIQARQHPELAGSAELAQYDWSKGIVYDPSPAKPPSTRPRPRPARTPVPAQDWSFLTWAYEQRAGDLAVALNGRLFHRNGRMSATVQIPAEGYLNVIALGQGDQTPTVLFPNQYQPDNHVTPGTLTLPSAATNYFWEQDLPAKYSAQLNKVLFLFSEKNVNMYQTGTGKDAFRSFSKDSRSTVVKESYGFAAALADYTIAK